jgi:hypothetical protein
MDDILWHVPRVAVIVTPKEVGEMADLVVEHGGALPEDFQPAAWLEANRIDLGIVARDAVQDVVFDALEGGLIDHPLLLHRRMNGDGNDRW